MGFCLLTDLRERKCEMARPRNRGTYSYIKCQVKYKVLFYGGVFFFSAPHTCIFCSFINPFIRSFIHSPITVLYAIL